MARRSKKARRPSQPKSTDQVNPAIGPEQVAAGRDADPPTLAQSAPPAKGADQSQTNASDSPRSTSTRVQSVPTAPSLAPTSLRPPLSIAPDALTAEIDDDWAMDTAEESKREVPSALTPARVPSFEASSSEASLPVPETPEPRPATKSSAASRPAPKLDSQRPRSAPPSSPSQRRPSSGPSVPPAPSSRPPSSVPRSQPPRPSDSSPRNKPASIRPHSLKSISQGPRPSESEVSSESTASSRFPSSSPSSVRPEKEPGVSNQSVAEVGSAIAPAEATPARERFAAQASPSAAPTGIDRSAVASPPRRRAGLIFASAVVLGLGLWLLLRGGPSSKPVDSTAPKADQHQPSPQKDQTAVGPEQKSSPIAPVAASVSALSASASAVPSTDLGGSAEPEASTPQAAPAPSVQSESTAAPPKDSDASPPDASAPPNSVAVRVEVNPPDASLALKGKEIRRPWTFKVPIGKKVVLEVARPGYRTRRVVLDGSRRVVNVGMVLDQPPEDVRHGPGR